MKRTRRQLLALLVLVIAAVTSLATSQGPPGVSQESGDRLTFNGDQRTEVRHVIITVVAGAGTPNVWADVPIETGGVNGKLPVVLSVVRDRDGASLNDDYATGYQAGDNENVDGEVDGIDSCSRGQTCTEAFTFTFVRIPEDARTSLDFGWSVRAWADYPELAVGASPPAGASLTVTISR